MLKGPLAEDIRRALMVLFVGVPADRRENSVAPGKYLVRNIIGLDPDKGILGVAEQVSAGEAMIFTMRDGQRAREDLGQMLQRQGKRSAGKSLRSDCISIAARAAIRSTASPASTRLIFARRLATCR